MTQKSFLFCLAAWSILEQCDQRLDEKHKGVCHHFGFANVLLGLVCSGVLLRPEDHIDPREVSLWNCGMWSSPYFKEKKKKKKGCS